VKISQKSPLVIGLGSKYYTCGLI